MLRILLLIILSFGVIQADEIDERAKEAWGVSRYDPSYKNLRFLPKKVEATAYLARRWHLQGLPFNQAVQKAKKQVQNPSFDIKNRFEIEDHSNLKKIAEKPFEIPFFSKRF